MSGDLITVDLRIPDDTARKIQHLAKQCGLTPNQMASAMFVLSFQMEPAKTKKPRKAKKP